MNITYTTPSHVELDIRRPNGTVETINYTAVNPVATVISDHMFRQIQAGTRKAGRGEVIAYRNIRREATRELTAGEIGTREYCEGYDRINNISRGGE